MYISIELHLAKHQVGQIWLIGWSWLTTDKLTESAGKPPKGRLVLYKKNLKPWERHGGGRTESGNRAFCKEMKK